MNATIGHVVAPLHWQEEFPDPVHPLDMNYETKPAPAAPVQTKPAPATVPAVKTTEQLRDEAENDYWEARCAKDEGRPYKEVRALEQKARDSREVWASSTGSAA